MVRGRAPTRGTRRGGAAAPGTRRQTETDDTAADQTAGEAAGAADAADTAMTAPTASTTTGAAGSSTSTRRGAATRGPGAGRFRPKNVRRDVAERDTLARQEQQKASDRAAEERRARGRSRFRSKRSRGDTMGSRAGINRNITTASGPFSSGAGGSGSSRSGGGWFGGGGSGSGGFGSGSGSKSSGSAIKTIKGDKGLPRFGQAGYGGPRETRINADKLHALTPDDELDSDDEAMMAALSGQSASTLPMGIYRKEHKESGVVVATTAELEAAENANNEEESLWVDANGANAQPPADQPEEGGVWDVDAGKSAVIKTEPDNDDSSMKLDSTADVSMAEDEKPAVVANPKKAIPQDPEDKIIQADLNLLASELGAVTVTEDGEAKTEGPANKDGRMYLFQFPPLLPPLKQTASPKPSTNVKNEPEGVDVLGVPPSTGHGTPVDLTQEEAGRESVEQLNGEPEDPDGFRSQLLSQGGMIGKLNVRKSGKVELDWGGQTLEMSPAAGMNFLTSAVIVEENDEKPQSDVIGGEGIGMGKIMGRFVLAPVWSDEEEWNVDPEELIAG